MPCCICDSAARSLAGVCACAHMAPRHNKMVTILACMCFYLRIIDSITAPAGLAIPEFLVRSQKFSFCCICACVVTIQLCIHPVSVHHAPQPASELDAQ